MNKTYNIFGKIVEIEFHSSANKQQIDAINEQFDLYLSHDKSSITDIKINIGKVNDANSVLSVNPSLHLEYKNGFQGKYPKVSVEILKTDILTVNVNVEPKRNALINYLKKLNNIQYCTIDERITQVLYELVLVPLIYFDKSKFLLHSSAFKKKNGGAILIGGTGGVGKTSLELELCMNRGFSFIADDISIVDDENYIWSNLSYPKIYAYNLKNNDKLKNRIFKNRSFSDKLAWKFKHFLNGPAGVRRTISPIEAFGTCQIQKTKIDKYYILIKSNVEKIKLEKISNKKATMMSLSVMQAEYYSFNNHILWHDFNCQALSKEPILNLNETFNRWQMISEKVFENFGCYIIHIPFNISHKEFTNSVAQLIENN